MRPGYLKMQKTAERKPLGFDDLAALDAAGADTQLLCSTVDLCLYRAQVHVPAAAGNVVCVRDVITELRALAADFTDLCHDKAPKPELFALTRPGGSPHRAICPAEKRT
jgi:hypothetical protein